MTRVLVAYGSKRGGTAGLADMLGAELVANGLEVKVHDASDVRNLHGFDAVVLGGALYALRWHKVARRFVRRHGLTLQTLPVWLFSSGPLDDSATREEIPPVRYVRKAMDRIGARGHMTFGGRLSADARGFPASSMARDGAGDWRDPDHVRTWAKDIAEHLHSR